MTITNAKLSKFRQRILELNKQIQHLSSRCLFIDPLIKGTPGQLYKRCGKSSCKCNTDPDGRHGPYKNIQIRINNKQKLIPLKKDDYHLWDLAKNYQYQIKKIKELEVAQQNLKDLVKAIVDERLVEFP